jgi:hypothetical protein
LKDLNVIENLYRLNDDVGHDSIVLKFEFQEGGAFIKDETSKGFFRSDEPSILGNMIPENISEQIS